MDRKAQKKGGPRREGRWAGQQFGGQQGTGQPLMLGQLQEGLKNNARPHLTAKQLSVAPAASRTVKENSAPASALTGAGRSQMCTSLPSVSICGGEEGKHAKRQAIGLEEG